MTDLLDVIPSFPTAQYSHLLPSLEKSYVTTSDLLTLDGIEVAKRAQLPLLDVKRLIAHVLASLQAELGVKSAHHVESERKKFEDVPRVGEESWGGLRTGGDELLARPWKSISLGDEGLDEVIGGGVPTGYITEFVGERSALSHSYTLDLALTILPPVVQPKPRSYSYFSSFRNSHHRTASTARPSTSRPSTASLPHV